MIIGKLLKSKLNVNAPNIITNLDVYDIDGDGQYNIQVGEPLVYALSIKNDGAIDASNVIISANLDSSTSFIPGSVTVNEVSYPIANISAGINLGTIPAKGVKNAIVITLGTGIGSGIIIDGKIYSGSNYNGAEIGHMVIEHNGVECSCGRKGCYEKYASTSALVRITKEFMQNAKSKDSLMFKLCSNDINKVSGRTAFTAAESNDTLAKAVLDKFFDYLACGIINVINIFQPEILCIGGGISKEGNKLLDPIMERVKKERYSKHAKTQTKLCIAKLNNDAGIIGAAMLKQN